MELTPQQIEYMKSFSQAPTQPTTSGVDGNSFIARIREKSGVPPAEVIQQKANTGQNQGFLDKTKKAISDVASGIGTGVLSTARQSSELLNKVGQYIPENTKQQFLTSPVLSPIVGILKGASKIAPLMSEGEKSIGAEEGALTKVPETTAGKVGYYGERVGEFLSPAGIEASATAVKKPLTLLAEKLYQSALKPKDIYKEGKLVSKAADVVKTGLKERVWLTQGGVERVANKIDDFENTLGEAIEQGKAAGQKIKTEGLQSYLNEAKKFFENQVDVKEAKKAVEEIDQLGKDFIKKYGSEIPIEIAQKIKVATGKMLKKYYDRLSSAGIEGQKQATRFLKEKIVEVAPEAGDINARLSNLYKFDNALTKAKGRIGNLNLLGLGPKIGAAVGGSKGAAIGLATQLLDSGVLKSGMGIALNELGKLGSKGVIPLNTLLGLIRAKIEESQ